MQMKLDPTGLHLSFLHGVSGYKSSQLLDEKDYGLDKNEANYNRRYSVSELIF